MIVTSALPGPCPDPASTGTPVLALVALGIVALIAGLVVLFLARTRRARMAAGLVALLLVTGALLTGPIGRVPANASTPGCGEGTAPPSHNSLTVRQTAVLTGLAPGVTPDTITGTVHNEGPDRALITTVTAAIERVTKSPTAAPGACGESDYVLLDPAMPVDRALAPGETLRFGGARLGFSDKTTNQDACQGASLRLRYTVS